jgi:hypothetical protein
MKTHQEDIGMSNNELVLSHVPVLKSNTEFRHKCELEGSSEVQSCVKDRRDLASALGGSHCFAWHEQVLLGLV